jgi:hypothetical protein
MHSWRPFCWGWAGLIRPMPIHQPEPPDRQLAQVEQSQPPVRAFIRGKMAVPQSELLSVNLDISDLVRRARFKFGHQLG